MLILFIAFVLSLIHEITTTQNYFDVIFLYTLFATMYKFLQGYVLFMIESQQEIEELDEYISSQKEKDGEN